MQRQSVLAVCEPKAEGSPAASLSRFPSRFAGIPELTAFFGVSRSTIDRWAKDPDDPMPHIKVRNIRVDTISPAFRMWIDRRLGWRGAGDASVPAEYEGKLRPLPDNP